MSINVKVQSPIEPSQVLHFIVPSEAQGLRLDRWIVDALSVHGSNLDPDGPHDPSRGPSIESFSRSQIQRWIKDGQVLVDDAPARSALKLESAQKVSVQLPGKSTDVALLPEAIPLAIIYEDDNLLIIDKPAGLVVHPAPGHESGTLVNAVLHHAPTLEGIGGERRPGIVHRLDKDTSGLIAVAKNDLTHRFLQEQFQARTVYKEYIALVEGTVSPEKGRISAPIGRHPTQRKRQAILPVNPNTGETKGRKAVTDYEVISVYNGRSLDGAGVANFTLARLILHTGRTHQIRVHMAWRKNPVVGDTTYGYRKKRLPLSRQFLHAHRLRLRLPDSETEREFISPLPHDLQCTLDSLAEPE